jgi:hypothetical protein
METTIRYYIIARTLPPMQKQPCVCYLWRAQEEDDDRKTGSITV